MNFIVGSLLMHCSEEVTFWLFSSLIEDHQMRDIYIPGVPGLYKHSAIFSSLLLTHQPELSEHLEKNCVRFEMYASDWCFALFANIVPHKAMHLFFDEFFKDGWVFFYRFTLAFLNVMSSRLM